MTSSLFLTAMVFGQSNVVTFEGQRYHICGEGDFVLLNSSSVKIVGRFQKSPFHCKWFIPCSYTNR